jgi:hypothetical protein
LIADGAITAGHDRRDGLCWQLRHRGRSGDAGHRGSHHTALF